MLSNGTWIYIVIFIGFGIRVFLSWTEYQMGEISLIRLLLETIANASVMWAIALLLVTPYLSHIYPTPEGAVLLRWLWTVAGAAFLTNDLWTLSCKYHFKLQRENNGQS